MPGGPGQFNKMGFSQEQKTETILMMELQKRWDDKLTASPENPFPLAPSDLVPGNKLVVFLAPDAIEVNEVTYTIENNAVSGFVDHTMGPRVENIKTELDGPNEVRLLGIGLGRGMRDLMKKVADKFKKVVVIDVAEVGCRNLDKIAESNGLTNVEAVRSEILEFWKAEKRGEPEAEDKVLVYYAEQFIHIQDEETKDKMMNHLGEFLAKPTNKEKTAFGRKVYLLHPLGEDNPIDKVKWETSVAYTMDQLRMPLEKGFKKGNLDIEVIGKHKYFNHQTYALIEISVPE